MSKNRRSRPSGASRAAVKLEMPVQEQATESPEYKYVIQDLKHVAILAAAMFALLIVLSFFIH